MRRGLFASSRRRSGGGGGGGVINSHMGVWAYDDATGVSYVGGTTASATLVQRWLDFAEGLYDSQKPLTDRAGGVGGIPKVMGYLDVMKIYVNSDGSYRSDSIPLINAGLGEAPWLHIPGTSATSGNRLKGAARADGSYNLHVNLNDASTRNWIVNYLRTHTFGGHTYQEYDGFFLDDWFSTLANGGFLYGAQGGYTTALEYPDDATMRSAMTTMLNALTRADGSAWKNAINALNNNPFLSSGLRWVGAPNVIGLIAEQVPFNTTLPTASYPDFFFGASRTAWMLDQIAYIMNNDPSQFFGNLSNTNGIAQRRRVGLAFQALAFIAGRNFFWNDVGSATLSVFPEQGIFPVSPFKTMGNPAGADFYNGSGAVATSGGHIDLRVATDVYAREFANAYYPDSNFNPQAIGKFAVILNASNAAVTVQQAWLQQNYSHQVILNGGTVQDGGTVSFAGSFTAGSTSIPARDAILLVA